MMRGTRRRTLDTSNERNFGWVNGWTAVDGYVRIGGKGRQGRRGVRGKGGQG